jgi:hypothetical protein
VILGKLFAAAVRTAAVVVPSGGGKYRRGVLRPSWEQTNKTYPSHGNAARKVPFAENLEPDGPKYGRREKLNEKSNKSKTYDFKIKLIYS